MSDHFGTFCIKGLSVEIDNKLSKQLNAISIQHYIGKKIKRNYNKLFCILIFHVLSTALHGIFILKDLKKKIENI